MTFVTFKMQAYTGWFLLNIWRNILHILTEFDTQKHQGKMKTKFEQGDLDLNFMKVICAKKVFTQYLKKYST